MTNKDKLIMAVCSQCSWLKDCLPKWGSECKFRGGKKIPRLKDGANPPTSHPVLRRQGRGGRP